MNRHLPSESQFLFAACAFLVSLLAGLTDAAAAQLDAVWIGGVANWNTSLNWMPMTVPGNNATNTFNVKIDNADIGTASIVTLNISTAIDNLTVDTGDTLAIDNTRVLTVVGGMNAGTIQNNGDIKLNASANLTGITATAGPVTLFGGGTIQMSNNINNRLISSSGGSFINVGNLIHGAGSIGVGVTDFSNAAMIQADEAAGITIDPSANPFVNTGTLRAQNGSTLRLQLGSFANDGGLIEALTGSKVDLTTATIIGGTVSTSGSGLIRTVASSSSVFAQGATPVTNLGNVEVSNGSSLRFIGSSFQNAGSITLVSTGSSTDLRPDTDTVFLSGGGEIIMGNQTNNRIIGVNGGSLVNVDNTIRGAGQIGANTMNFTNQASVIADSPTTLSLDPLSQFVNAGSYIAQGATLRLINGFFDNTNGVIEAQSGGIVELSAATISGGLITASGGGFIRAASNSSLNGDVSPVSIDCAIDANNSVDIALRGMIQNSGSLNLNAAGSATDIQATDGVVTLTGGGFINMANSVSARIVGLSGGSLVNVDNTIRGSGAIGVGTLDVTNQGLIIANQSVELTVDPATNPFINTGVLRATSGGTLSLTSGAFNNHGGSIEAEDNSLITLVSATISGGELSTTGSGIIRIITAATFDGTAHIPSNSGYIELMNNADVIFLGAFNNSGTIHLASVASVTDFELHNGPVTLTGGGQVTTSNMSTNRIFGVSGGSLINVDNTISGSGSLGLGLTPITNQGTILANQSVALTIAPDSTFGLVNSGTLRATNSATMTIAAGPFTTSGNVIVDPGATISRTGAFTQTSGATTVNGTLIATGPIQIQGGTLFGSGTITGSVTSSGITAPGNSAGQLNISGTYTQQSSGTLAVEIGGPTPGSQYDRLAVGSAANLDGTITISFINGFTPMIGQTFTVMTYPSRTGTFANVDVPCPPGFGVAVNVLATSVRVDIVAPSGGLGDMNCDCVVSVVDVPLFALALLDPVEYGMQQTDCAVIHADINQDTFINGADIAGFIDLLLP